MRSTRGVFLSAVMMLVAPSAYAAARISAAAPVSPLPTSAATVSDYLIACEIHHDTCSLKVGNALVDKIDLQGTAQLCLDSGYDVNAILKWLSSHPDTHQMPTEDGIYVAMKSLYPCR
jgi:hypothetical protein